MAGVTSNTDGQQVITRIGFAERWLDRAKRQCQDGDVDRGLLTMVLASAEMAHAIRTTPPCIPARRRWTLPSVAAIAALTAVGAFAGWQWRVPLPASSTEAPVVVRLDDRIGSLLQPVEAAPQIGDQAVTREASLPGRAPVVNHSSQPKRHTKVIQPVAGRQTVPTAATPAAVVRQSVRLPAQAAVSVPPPATTIADDGLSASDLIDLVLAAERTLRKQAQP